MVRSSWWLAVVLAVGLAASGAAAGFFLADSRWAVLGAVIGAVTGSFAPSVYDAILGRAAQRDKLRGAFERLSPQSWARQLDPRRELVDFIGRDGELAELMTWCESDDSGRLRLVTGPGGVGKTRLAVELAGRLRTVGWKAERIADGAEAGAIALLRAVTRGRALLVVDYAEARAGLEPMLADLAGEQGQDVRVLFLARSAGDWLDQLGVTDPAVWDLLQDAREAQIVLAPAVSSRLSDSDVIALAVRSFAKELGLPEKKVEIYGGTGRRRVLDLHAAALVAVLDEPTASTVRVDVGKVMDELLRHEQHFWYDTARACGLLDGQDGLTTQALRQVIAAGCLLGAASQAEARDLAARVPGMSSSTKIGGWLRDLYPPDPGESEWIGSVQPDGLAGLHAIRELAAAPEFARACLASLDARQALRAVTLLARASADHPEAESLLAQSLPGTASLIAGMPVPAETLMTIYNAIPFPTVILAPAAVALAQRIISLLPADTEPAIRAYWLSNLGVRLSGLGRPAEALPVAEEAVAIRRELAAASPDRYRPDLAASLSNLGVTFSELGRPAEALPVAEEAVAIRRELAAASPDRYRPDLAASLSNLGVTFSELGRPAEALPVAEEAVAIRRELAAASPDRYRPDLAASLSNLGVTFSELGRPADALPVGRGSRRHPPGAGRRQPGPLPPRPRRFAVQPRRHLLGAGPPRRRPASGRGSDHHVLGAGRRQPGPLPPRPRRFAGQPRHPVGGAGPPRRRPAGD